MVEFHTGELIIWDPLFSPYLGYPNLRGFEERAQKPNMRFDIQLVIHPTGFSDFKLY